MADPIEDVKGKSKEFYEKAKSGTLDEATLKWGLSAGAVIAGVSLIFNYYSWQIDSSFIRGSGGVTGLDLLRFQGGNFESLAALAIPLTAIYSLYLHFGEPSAKLLKLETPGRLKLIYLIGLIAAALGVVGCSNFLRHQICLGSFLGLVGLGLLAFVYFKLWQMAPADAGAPANGSAPATTPAPESATPPVPAASGFCANCGQPRSSGAFCASCGSKF